MGGLYDILEAYRQQNDPRFIYEGLYEEPAYTGPSIDPIVGARQFGNMERGPFGVPKQATGIMQQETLRDLGIDTSYGVANEEDVEQVESLVEPTGIAKLMQYVPFIGNKSLSGSLLRNLIPKQDPRATNIKNFYGSQYGLTPTGQIASGIMKGYNPVSGGLFGQPAQFGLANAARRRIERIAKRKAPQTEASRRKIKELQDFARADTISRGRQAAPDVYAAADKLGLTDSSGGFKSTGTNENFSNKTGRGRTGY